MSATADPGFIGDVPPRRRSAQPAPLDVWLRTLLIGLLLSVVAGAWFVFGRTPMPAKVDSPAFGKQLAGLDRQVRRIRGEGGRPIELVFLGTSRMRNVALDSAAMADAARQAGVVRPVATTVLGVNWGGFERFAAVLPLIARRRPDVIVVMPELLTQDFSPSMRLQMGLAWLQSLMWGREYRPFPADETTAKVCNGFADSPAARDARDRAYVEADADGQGPRQARSFLRRMTDQGTQVFVTDIPVSGELAAIRPPLPANWPTPAAMGLNGPGFDAVRFRDRIDKTAYCDHAHLDPARADAWRRPFFREAAAKLNALPK